MGEAQASDEDQQQHAQVSCMQRRFRHGIQTSRPRPVTDLDLLAECSITERCVDVEAPAVFHVDAPLVFAVLEDALGVRIPAFRQAEHQTVKLSSLQAHR